jgi:hypothetical protein
MIEGDCEACVNDCRMAVAQGLDDLLVCYNLATAHAALGDLNVRPPARTMRTHSPLRTRTHARAHVLKQAHANPSRRCRRRACG